jgi:hypothetical protein
MELSMIHVVADYEGLTRTTEGDLMLLLAISDSEVTEGLKKLEGKRVVIDMKTYSEKRSLNANKYFWKLCTLIAEKCGTDKDSIYDLMLTRYGQYTDIECEPNALASVKALFRVSEVVHEDFINESEKITLRGYFGSSSYTSKEMSELINGVKQECEDYGIETWSQDEINRLLGEWESERGK